LTQIYAPTWGSYFVPVPNQDGNIKIDIRLEDETVWLKQAHLCKLFQKSKSTISKHIKNIVTVHGLQLSVHG